MDELEQRRPQGLVSTFAERRHRAGPELPPDDGCALERVALYGIEAVEPRREKRLDRRRQRRERGIGAGLGEHRHELLRVERVALRRVRHAEAKLGREDAGVVESVEQLRRLAGGERVEPDDCSVPARTFLEQLGPGETEEEDRRVAAPAAHVLDEVEQRRLGPVHVLEHDEQRPLARQSLEEAPHRPEELLRRAGVVAPECAEPLNDQIRVSLVAHRVGHGVLAAEGADELRERPERDPVAVGETASCDEGCGRAGLGHELRNEARLAHTGGAHDRYEPAVPGGGARCELLAQGAELAQPTDERRVRTAGKGLSAGDRAEQAPGRNR